MFAWWLLHVGYVICMLHICSMFARSCKWGISEWSERRRSCFHLICVCAQRHWPIRRVRALNANNSKTVKANDLIFDKHVSRDSPDTTAIIVWKESVAKVTWPHIYLTSFPVFVTKSSFAFLWQAPGRVEHVR